MQDGSDQEKYRVVRVLRMSKGMSGAGQCPRLKLLGSLAHGIAACFYIIEEDVVKDSQLTVEALFTTIEESKREYAKQGKSMPEHLWVQVDNAPGENKNQHVFTAVAGLVAKGVFKSATIAFLRVGHTHEDLDGLWGVNATVLGKVTQWDSPNEIIQHTRRVMEATLGRLHVLVQRLDFVRPWKAWNSPLGVAGFKGVTGKGSPHYYRFSRREDLPAELLPRVDAVGDPKDVMLEIKEFMASPELCQDIVCVIPAAHIDAAGPPPSSVLPRATIGPKMKADLKKFIDALKIQFPERTGAMDYITEWMTRSTSCGLTTPHLLTFFDHRCAAGPPVFAAPASIMTLHHQYPVKAVQVTRVEAREIGQGAKRARSGPANMEFTAYVAHRVSQGHSAEDAQREWNGMALLRLGHGMRDV